MSEGPAPVREGLGNRLWRAPLDWAKRLFSRGEDSVVEEGEAFMARPDFALAGRWDVLGFTPDGQRYRGDVILKPMGEGYGVMWRITEGAFADQNYKGYGLATARSVSVAFQGGMALYNTTGDGRLAGGWITFQGQKAGSEVWTPSGH